MKEHPDRQPRGAVSVQSGNHHYRQANQDFEGDWIDGDSPIVVAKPRSTGNYFGFFLFFFFSPSSESRSGGLTK